MATIQSESEVAVKPKHPYGVVATWCVVFFVLVPSLCAQETTAPRHTGVPQDWSQSHILFSRDALARHPDLIDREPRILQQAMQRWQTPDWGAFHGVDSQQIRQQNSGLNGDWSVGLGAGSSRLRVNSFPAKFSFDPSAPPDCINDYVVFGLEVPGVTAGQANLVAFNNLYVEPGGTGLCPGTLPNVLFAYNVTTAVGGKILTSPVLSLDGKKITFVESVPGSPAAIFHVLTWASGQGSIGNAANPNNILAGMTSLTFPNAVSDTLSSPWVDYDADTAYVGDDKGHVYQIHPVFSGPPVLSGGIWPVTVG